MVSVWEDLHRVQPLVWLCADIYWQIFYFFLKSHLYSLHNFHASSLRCDFMACSSIFDAAERMILWVHLSLPPLKLRPQLSDGKDRWRGGRRTWTEQIMFSVHIICLPEITQRREKTGRGKGKKSLTSRQSFIRPLLVHPRCASLFGSAAEWTTGSFSDWKQMTRSNRPTALGQLLPH